MNQLVVPISYMGSGSSAITDLVSEIKGYEAQNDTFEYVFLHCPNGVFDLEDKLLVGNNALRSDEALHSFCDTMKQLYDKKWWWVGNYKERVSPNFFQLAQNYLSRLIQFQPEFYWYMQENTNFRMFCQLVLRRFVSCITLGKKQLKKPLRYHPVWISYPSAEEFYQASHDFLYQVMADLGLKHHSLILDQLLLPHNLHRIDHYFDDDLRAFVISRDPRDVFIINKYIWPAQNEQVIYPTEVRAFCSFYRKLRESEKPCSSSKILRLRFEDLIYRYEDTVAEILRFLRQEKSAHIHKKQFFCPEVSIENTQLFLNASYKEESQVIQEQLPEYLYDFPYQREPQLNKTF